MIVMSQSCIYEEYPEEIPEIPIGPVKVTSFDSEDTGVASDDSSPALAIVLIILAVLIVIGAGIIVYILNKRRNRSVSKVETIDVEMNKKMATGTNSSQIPQETDLEGAETNRATTERPLAKEDL